MTVTEQLSTLGHILAHGDITTLFQPIVSYMDSPSLQAPFALAPVPTAHVYSASDICIVSMRAMMGYSRAGSQSLFRASRTWTFEGFSSAGSTGLPSFRLLRNRG